MKPLLAAAAEVQHFLRGAGEQFCFIGGIALQRWGEPRFTRDVPGLLDRLRQLRNNISHQD